MKKNSQEWIEHLRNIGFKKGNKPPAHHIYSGAEHPNWKGDSVGYAALHQWIAKRLPKTKLCQNCKKEKPLDLANKSNKYLRELSDWWWLCRRCHMELDGRLLNFIIAGNPLGRKHSQLAKTKMSIARKLYWQFKPCNYNHGLDGKFIGIEYMPEGIYARTGKDSLGGRLPQSR